MHHDQNHSPFTRFLIGSIRGYALCYLCLATVGLWPFLLVWFLFFRLCRGRHCATAPPIIGPPPALPPPLPPVIVADDGRSPANEEIQSFAA